MNTFLTTTAQPISPEKPSFQSHPLTGLEASASIVAIGIAITGWFRAELKNKSAAAEAETALIKSLQQELTDKDEEIDQQRIRIWRLEKEIRMLRQTVEYSGSFPLQERIN
ncbi:hypothetical protein ACE1CI_31395 [Aerosakkonemataceae cyanobacterium BLCC-F50]|uniref:Uncharacterized protein n=1 Tax=Floridaenema flaviceps BLCC-F50 TaxID=3153642 RepID=A0ABV4Y0C2_9CYAN